jgi:hypothetical protein
VEVWNDTSGLFAPSIGLEVVPVAVAPIKLNARQEAFAVEIANGSPASVAYAKVYPGGSHNHEIRGSQLLKVVKVRDRIFQLRRYQSAATRITLPFLTSQLLEIAQLATEAAQYNAAQSAVLGIAKLHGFMVDRSLVEVSLRKPAATPESPDEMDEAQWLRDYGLQLEAVAEQPADTTQSSPITYKV